MMKMFLFFILLSQLSHAKNMSLLSHAELIAKLEKGRNTFLSSWSSDFSSLLIESNQKQINDERAILLKSIKDSPEDLKRTIRLIHNSKRKINDDVIDTLFGIDYEKTEESINQLTYEYYAWINFPKEASQTSYDTAREIFSSYLTPTKNHTIVDLGSGYGRILLYGASLFPRTKFVGIELVEERTKLIEDIVKNTKLTNIKVINQDVTKVDLSMGTHFYLFNPFPPLMEEVLNRLREISVKKKIFIITTGSSSVELLSIKWLKKVKSSGDFNKFRALAIFESK